MVLLPVLGLLGGLALIYVGSEGAVRGAVGLAEALRMRRFAAGFTFVALTTSLPELAVALVASLEGAPGIAVGNAFGSSLANLTLILGLAVLLAGTLHLARERPRDVADTLLVTALVSALLLRATALTALHGALLAGLFVAFAVRLQSREPARAAGAPPVPRDRPKGTAKGLALFLGSAAVLLLGSELTVRGAVGLLERLAVSAELMGLTAVALGTSLPELSMVVRAIRRGEHALAVGDLFGATVVNLTLVLGLVALLGAGPVGVAEAGGAALFILVAVLGAWYLLSTGRPVTRRVALVLVGLYALFLAERLGGLPTPL